MPCETIPSTDGTNSIVTPVTSSKPAPLPPRNKYQTGISPSIGASLQQAHPTKGPIVIGQYSMTRRSRPL